MLMKDKVFKTPVVKKFEFDEAVASVFDDKKLDKQMIDIYYAYKKREGYSENVLIPFTMEEHK